MTKLWKTVFAVLMFFGVTSMLAFDAYDEDDVPPQDDMPHPTDGGEFGEGSGRKKKKKDKKRRRKQKGNKGR